jgi:hypothetical protein
MAHSFVNMKISSSVRCRWNAENTGRESAGHQMPAHYGSVTPLDRATGFLDQSRKFVSANAPGAPTRTGTLDDGRIA